MNDLKEYGNIQGDLLSTWWSNKRSIYILEFNAKILFTYKTKKGLEQRVKKLKSKHGLELLDLPF